MSKEVTIIIPTKDRFKFLKKNIEYYIFSKFRGVLLILDSSSYVDAKKNKNFIKKCSLVININYYHKKTLPNQIIKFYSSKIKTKYSIIGADDDFYIPSTINSLVKILNRNKENKIILGEVFRLDILDERIHVNKFPVQINNNYTNLQKKISDYLKNYISIAAISIIETKLLNKLFTYVPDTKELKKCPIQGVSNEILITSLMFLSTKILISNKLLTLRLIHGNNSMLPKKHNKEQIEKSTEYFINSINDYLTNHKNYKLSKKNKDDIGMILSSKLKLNIKSHIFNIFRNKSILLLKNILLKFKYTKYIFYYLKKSDKDIDIYILNKNNFYKDIEIINEFIVR